MTCPKYCCQLHHLIHDQRRFEWVLHQRARHMAVLFWHYFKPQNEHLIISSVLTRNLFVLRYVYNRLIIWVLRLLLMSLNINYTSLKMGQRMWNGKRSSKEGAVLFVHVIV